MTDRRSRGEPRHFVIPGDATDHLSLRSGIEAFLESLLVRNYSPLTIEMRNEHLAKFAVSGPPKT
jgi:hypothetical protein